MTATAAGLRDLGRGMHPGGTRDDPVTVFKPGTFELEVLAAAEAAIDACDAAVRA